MGGTKIGKFTYFLAGGLTSSRSIIGREAYIYNSESNTVEIKEKMLD